MKKIYPLLAIMGLSLPANAGEHNQMVRYVHCSVDIWYDVGGQKSNRHTINLDYNYQGSVDIELPKELVDLGWSCSREPISIDGNDVWFSCMHGHKEFLIFASAMIDATNPSSYSVGGFHETMVDKSIFIFFNSSLTSVNPHNDKFVRIVFPNRQEKNKS